jgi:hypothetical protein
MDATSTIKRVELVQGELIRSGEAPVWPVPARTNTPKKPPRIGRNLDTLWGWQRELSNLYRAARRGDIDPQEATRFTYMARESAKVTKDCQLLLETRMLREELQRLGVSVSPELSTYLEAE